MKKLLGLALLLLPSLCFADRLGSLRSSADVLLTTQSATTSGVIISTSSLQVGATFFVSSGTVAGPLSITGAGNGSITLTINSSTYSVTSSSSGSYSVGQPAYFGSLNGTLIGGAAGVAVGGSAPQIQYAVNATTLGGVPNTGVWASSVTFSTMSILVQAGQSSNIGFNGIGGPGILDVYVASPYTQNRTLFSVGSGAQLDQFYVPNNHFPIAALGIQGGQLVVGDTTASGQQIYSFGDPNNYFQIRSGSSATIHTGTSNGPGDVRIAPGDVWIATFSALSGITLGIPSSTTTILGTVSGLALSSGTYYPTTATNVITATASITPGMAVVLASCTTRGASPNAWITLTLPPSSSNGDIHTIYNVGADSCSIIVKGNGTDLIEGTGTIRLDAQTQHASVYPLGNGLWGSGNGGIQYPPWSIFTTQDDVGTFTNAVSSQVVSCPIYVPVPLGFMGFRINRVSGNGLMGASIADVNGKYVIGVSSMNTVVGGAVNYFSGGVFPLAPGWYRLFFSIPNVATTVSGSNSVNSNKMFCSTVGTSSTGMDLSGFVATLPGTTNSGNYPAVDLLFNGSLQSF